MNKKYLISIKVNSFQFFWKGYGSTESCGGSFSTSAKDPTIGHVGGPRGNSEFKLVDIPDMNYTSLD